MAWLARVVAILPPKLGTRAETSGECDLTS
jgi:hypothetical protein